jgi:hypothetical protein
MFLLFSKIGYYFYSEEVKKMNKPKEESNHKDFCDIGKDPIKVSYSMNKKLDNGQYTPKI